MGALSSSFMCKDQRRKEEKRDGNMIKVTSHLELITKHMMGLSIERVNAIDARDTISFKDMEEEIIYENLGLLPNYLKGFHVVS